MKTRFALAAALAVLLLPTVAQAHISLHPNTIPAGAFATIDVRVPGEEEGAYVKKVDVQFPPGFIGADYENVVGWSAKVIESKLAKPIQTDDGPIDSEVSQIIWTWTGPLGKVDNGQFIDFPLSLAIPEDAAGKALEFRTVQTYSNGQVVHWIEPSLEAEHPSPRINITAKGGVIEDVAGDEAGPAAGQTGGRPSFAPAPAPASVKSSSGASKGLGIAALIIGALGLIAAIVALGASRRKAAA
ncbi:MAG TPA: YcnI family protein [Solirubrobacteraceae bacterium]|nr:YcnI family protein [Solirubrobacteraceae bacterium]